MRQNDIKELPKLNSENLENLFNVYQEENGLYYYNILQSIIFPQDLPKALFTSYIITYGDTWPFISYKVYESPNLWWLILLANNIDNPLILPEPGKELNIPVIEVVREVLAEIKKR
jgi:nucleoid-associated protein YgaU